MAKRNLSINELQKKIEQALEQDQKGGDFSDKNSSELLEQLNIYRQELELQNNKLQRIQQEMESSKVHFQMLFDHAPAGYVIFDRDFVVEAVNETFLSLMDLSASQVKDTKITNFLHPDSQDDFYFHVKSLFQEHQTESMEAILLGRENEIPVKIESNYFEEDGKSYAHTAFLEISRQNDAEDQLRSALEKFSVAFKTSPNVITITTMDEGRYLEVNDKFEEVTGYSAEEVVDKTADDINIWVDDSFRHQIVQEIERTGHLREMEGNFRRKDGSIGITRISAEKINIAGQDCLLASFEDITWKKSAEQKINHLNRVLSSIRKVNQLIVQGNDEYALIEDVCDTLTERQGYETAWIILLDNGDEAGYAAVSGVGISGELKKTFNADHMNHCAKRALKTDELILSERKKEFCRDCPLFATTEYKDIFVQRLAYKENIYGVIAASLPSEMAQDKDEQNLFVELAGDVSFALSGIKAEKNKLDVENKLKQSELKYRELFNEATVGIFQTTSRGDPVLINQAMAYILGVESQEQAKTFYGDLKNSLYVNPKRRDEFIRLLNETGEVKDFQYLARRVDGKQVWLRMTAKKSKQYEDGTFLIDGFTTDVSTRVEAQKKRKESEEKFREIFENVNDAIMIHGITEDKMPDRFTEVNSLACSRLGYSRGEMLQMSKKDIINDFKDEKAREVIQILLDKEYYSSQVYERTKSGQLIPVEISSHLYYTGEQYLVLSVSRDISERIQTKKALEKSERRFSLAVDSAEIGVWEYDLKNDVFLWDEWMLKLYGISRETFDGNYYSWIECLDPEDRERVEKELEMAIAGIKAFDTEFRIRKPSGELSHLKANAVVERDENDNAVKVIGVNYDITDRKNYELLLRQQNKEYETMNEELTQTNEELLKAKEKAEESDRLKSAFLANMSHEIRTPLNGILGFSDLLSLPDIEEEKKQQYFGVIKQNGQRLMRLINDLIDISKIEAGQVELNPEEVDVNKMLYDLEVLFKQQNDNSKVKIHFEYGKNIQNASIFSDYTRLSQVFTNLIRNSMKFTKEGYIQCGYQLQEKKLEFYVKDTGVGISDKVKDYIFERFRQGATSLTRAYEGSGLGLSISKGIIELLGGEIWFESRENKGTTFFFSHPVDINKVQKDNGSRKTEEDLAGEARKQDWRFDGKKVLLVEDDISSQMLLSQYLEDMNVHVTSVEDGEKAIIKCKKENVDLVLMDIKLPAMDGYQAYRQIKEMKPNLPVIAQTAYAMSGDKNKALKFGFDDYVSKPLARETLAKILSRFLI